MTTKACSRKSTNLGTPSPAVRARKLAFLVLLLLLESVVATPLSVAQQGSVDRIEGILGVNLCAPFWQFLLQPSVETWAERWGRAVLLGKERSFSRSGEHPGPQGPVRYNLDVGLHQQRIAVIKATYWPEKSPLLSMTGLYRFFADSLRALYPPQPLGRFLWKSLPGLEGSVAVIEDPYGNGMVLQIYPPSRLSGEFLELMAVARGYEEWPFKPEVKTPFCSQIPGSPEPTPPPTLAVLSGGTPISLHLKGIWHIDQVRKGLQWEIPIVDDVRANGLTVFPRGTKVIATISQDPIRRNFFQFRNVIRWTFEPLLARDGTAFRLVRESDHIILVQRGLLDSDLLRFWGKDFELAFREPQITVDLVTQFFIDRSRLVRMSP
jgi:hypothetical protein